MDKLLVYEAMKDVLNESTEWGDSCKEGGYYEFVSGVVYMVNDLIKKINDINEKLDDSLTVDGVATSTKENADRLYGHIIETRA